MPARRKSGFTLIELLVVIAIIAILAAILFPVFARAREAARKSQCASNMKECAISLHTYWNDYDATLPASNPSGGNYNAAEFTTFGCVVGVTRPNTSDMNNRRTWAQKMWDHMRSKDIMWCPSDSTERQPTNDADSYDITKCGVSYWWKYAIDQAWWGQGTQSNRKCQKESDFGYTADQIVLYEHAGFHSNEGSGVKNGTKINVAFLDTHVKSASVRNCGTAVTTSPTAAGEPRYFNFDQTKAKNVSGSGTLNPPVDTSATTWVDPELYTDFLP